MMIAAPKVKSILSQSGLLLPELSTLANALGKTVSPAKAKDLVLDDNILAKPTAQSRQRIWNKLIARYRIHAPDDAFGFWWELIPASESNDLAQLATLRWAQHDLLLRFLWNEIYLPRRAMDATLQSDDLIRFVREIGAGYAARAYFFKCSDNVQIRIAQHFLLMLRECGAATGRKNKRFTTLPAGENAVRFAAYLAKTESPGSQEILNHWALRWWGGGSSKADEILREGL